MREVNHNPDPLIQVGLLLNASRPIEATTPFFLWVNGLRVNPQTILCTSN